MMNISLLHSFFLLLFFYVKRSQTFQKRSFLKCTSGSFANNFISHENKVEHHHDFLINNLTFSFQFYSFYCDNLGSVQYPLRSSMKKKKNKDQQSITSETSSKRTRFAMGAEQTNVQPTSSSLNCNYYAKIIYYYYMKKVYIFQPQKKKT